MAIAEEIYGGVEVNITAHQCDSSRSRKKVFEPFSLFPAADHKYVALIEFLECFFER